MGTSEEEAEQRCRNVQMSNGALKLNIVADLQEMLHQNHKYVKVFKYALEQMEERPDLKLKIMADQTPAGEHERRYNAPVSDDVAIIVVDEELGSRDIVLKQRSGSLDYIRETHRAYDALQYPLIFWKGQDGYNFSLKKINPATGQEKTGRNSKVSCKDFYSYHFMERDEEVNYVLRFGRVTCQLMVDSYAKMEAERLLYIRLNQSKLRAEEYIHLKDAIVTDGINPEDIGQPVILPSSFTGGPRYMAERTQDAMSYVRKFGHPDLFITFTCNPAWPEIKNVQDSNLRHDIIARVFSEKQKKLLWLLKKGMIFGDLVAWMYTIEWQKRGLPHSHTLIWCKDKIRPDDIDRIISAELPDPEMDPELFKTISTQMIHGPCGSINPRSVCMKDNKCQKGFPKQLRRETETGDDGYPEYRRISTGDGGHTAKANIRSVGEYNVDNRWVVPHNKMLCKIFNAHINVELCSSVKSIKYVCKYVNKGSDMATFEVGDKKRSDEISRFQSGRYISTNESVWRILGFNIHERYPTVINLAVHLENGQRVYYTAETAQNKTWNRRKKDIPVDNYPGVYASSAIGRVYTVHPKNRDCFFLRLLLHTVRGPTSFKDLRRVNGQDCATFRDACRLHGLLEEDEHWKKAMDEAAVSQAPKQLWQLFSIILAACDIQDPEKLWEDHKGNMSEDFLHLARRQNPGVDIDFNCAIYNQALIELEKHLIVYGTTMANCGMPQPENSIEGMAQELLRETNYNMEELTTFVEQNVPRMVEDQQQAFTSILKSVDDDAGKIFFLDAPGGTGKTFLINIILAKVRQKSEIALAVASSGIAATLLEGGRTAHSTFKLPLDLTKQDTPTCNISKNSAKAKILQQCKIIIWDEATMNHKQAFEAVNRTLQDIRNNNRIMGGVTTVLAGDFRQTLPVIQRGTRADQVKACIKSSYLLWPHVQRLTLNTNMRVHLLGDNTAGAFSSQLLKVGNGLYPQDASEQITLPFGQFVETKDDLIKKVFPNMETQFQDSSWLAERDILAPQEQCCSRDQQFAPPTSRS
uniref:uncharacterized protein n=1 Tax=Myxine glutinosa TaxID=7769 RepID=UPI00358E883F